jgi:hypothetical protein
MEGAGAIEVAENGFVLDHGLIALLVSEKLFQIFGIDISVAQDTPKKLWM